MYTIIGESRTWAEAHDRCTSGLGGQLASVQSLADLSLLSAALNASASSSGKGASTMQRLPLTVLIGIALVHDFADFLIFCVF